MSPVHSSVQDGICSIVIDNPPVNASSHAVREGLVAAFQAAGQAPDVRAIVLACAGKTFVAGADIREFGKPPLDPHLSVVIDLIERSPRPVVAAIHGTALGGGFELALGCHYRLMARTASLGFPEVSLGIIPGAGGIARIARLAASEDALGLLLSDKRLGAEAALAAGIVDRVVDDEVGAAAVDFARELVAAGRDVRRTRDLPVRMAGQETLAAARARLDKSARGRRAPFACLDLYQAERDGEFDAAIARSRAAFRELVVAPEGRGLRQAFFNERSATRSPGLPEPGKPLEKAGVIGAGTMGTGIAVCLLDAGLEVFLVDSDAQKLAGSQAAIEAIYDGRVAKNRASPEDRQRRLGRLRLVARIADLADADIVIEAVFEDMAVKKLVFAELDLVIRSDAVLATNTSYLNVDDLADGVSHPERVVGMHFFSPAHLMPLLENVRGRRSSPQVLADIQALGRRMKKVPVLVGVSDGFVGNRMLARRAREAYFLLEEGALPEQVDRVLYEFGFPIGQFQLNDLAGLDVAWRNRQGRLDRLSPREAAITILDDIVALGRHGQKTGAGFYRYDERRRHSVDPVVTELVIEQSRRSGVVRREIGDDEIRERCLFVMINEAARILEEGVASRPEEIDAIWVNGYGFPRHRGGPLLYADEVGIPFIVERIRHYAKAVGEAYWAPAPRLVRMAETGETFYAR